MPFRRTLRAAAPTLFAAALAAAAFVPAAPAPAAPLPPLQTGVDGTYAPHAFPKLGGGLQGFQIDLFNEVARRIHRKIEIHGASFSGLIPALLAGRYDFLTAPVTVTPERAKAMIFTQGYLWTEYQFGIRKGTPPITGWADLKGKAVSVNKGTPMNSLPTRKPRNTASRSWPSTPSRMRCRRCCRGTPMPILRAIRWSNSRQRRPRCSSPA